MAIFRSFKFKFHAKRIKRNAIVIYFLYYPCKNGPKNNTFSQGTRNLHCGSFDYNTLTMQRTVKSRVYNVTGVLISCIGSGSMAGRISATIPI